MVARLHVLVGIGQFRLSFPYWILTSWGECFVRVEPVSYRRRQLIKKKLATLAATAGLLTFSTVAPALAAPVSAGSVSLPDASGIVGSATSNAASIVGSASAPDTGGTQTAKLALKETGGVANNAVDESNQTARVAITESNQTAQGAVDAALGR